MRVVILKLTLTHDSSTMKGVAKDQSLCESGPSKLPAVPGIHLGGVALHKTI